MSGLITGTRPDLGWSRRAGLDLLKEIGQLEEVKRDLLRLDWTNEEIAKAMAQARVVAGESGGIRRFIDEMRKVVEQAQLGKRPFKNGE